MTVQELYDALEEMLDQGLGDVEILMATQPTYPLQSHIRGVWSYENEDNGKTYAYVVEGAQVHDDPYAPRDAFLEATC